MVVRSIRRKKKPTIMPDGGQFYAWEFVGVDIYLAICK